MSVCMPLKFQNELCGFSPWLNTANAVVILNWEETLTDRCFWELLSAAARADPEQTHPQLMNSVSVTGRAAKSNAASPLPPPQRSHFPNPGLATTVSMESSYLLYSKREKTARAETKK